MLKLKQKAKMKIKYEKYDDTVQFLNDDKVPDWKPTAEIITVEILGNALKLTTEYQNNQTHSTVFKIIERHEDRIIAQHIDEHMGITIFVQNPAKTGEATLTLMNDNYIVGRYLRRIKED